MGEVRDHSPSILRSTVTVEPHSLEWAVADASGASRPIRGIVPASSKSGGYRRRSAWIWPESRGKPRRPLIAAASRAYIGSNGGLEKGARGSRGSPEAEANSRVYGVRTYGTQASGGTSRPVSPVTPPVSMGPVERRDDMDAVDQDPSPRQAAEANAPEKAGAVRRHDPRRLRRVRADLPRPSRAEAEAAVQHTAVLIGEIRTARGCSKRRACRRSLRGAVSGYHQCRPRCSTAPSGRPRGYDDFVLVRDIRSTRSASIT